MQVEINVCAGTVHDSCDSANAAYLHVFQIDDLQRHLRTRELVNPETTVGPTLLERLQEVVWDSCMPTPDATYPLKTSP